MKKYLYAATMLVSLAAEAQIQVGSNEIATMNRAGRISGKDMESFRQTTTLFTLPFRDYDRQPEFEAMLRSVWTITPWKIIRPDEMQQYAQEGRYSIFSFGGFMISRGGSAPHATHMHLSYDLWLPEAGKKGNVRKQLLSRVLIYPDNETFFTAMTGRAKRNDDFNAQMLSFVYNDALIYNWSPGMLGGYLKEVNDRLLAGDERGPFTEYTDKAALKSLVSDTLYVPDYVQVRFNMFTGAGKAEEEGADEELKKAYPYPVKIVPVAALDRLIADREHPIKYLVYIKSSTDKYINVYDSRDHRLLYARYVKVSYNFRNKDLSRIARLLD